MVGVVVVVLVVVVVVVVVVVGSFFGGHLGHSQHSSDSEELDSHRCRCLRAFTATETMQKANKTVTNLNVISDN